MVEPIDCLAAYRFGGAPLPKDGAEDGPLLVGRRHVRFVRLQDDVLAALLGAKNLERLRLEAARDDAVAHLTDGRLDDGRLTEASWEADGGSMEESDCTMARGLPCSMDWSMEASGAAHGRWVVHALTSILSSCAVDTSTVPETATKSPNEHSGSAWRERR